MLQLVDNYENIRKHYGFEWMKFCVGRPSQNVLITQQTYYIFDYVLDNK